MPFPSPEPPDGAVTIFVITDDTIHTSSLDMQALETFLGNVDRVMSEAFRSPVINVTPAVLHETLQNISQVTQFFDASLELNEEGKRLVDRVVRSVECIRSLLAGLETGLGSEGGEQLKAADLNIEVTDALRNLVYAVGTNSNVRAVQPPTSGESAKKNTLSDMESKDWLPSNS